MKRAGFCAVACAALYSCVAWAGLTELQAGFANPPNTAKPHTWWHWMNGNVTKAGIVADLDAMKEIGIGGAQIFDAGCEIPEGGVCFNTPEWMELVTFACKEAEKRGIEICLSNCSGWSSSGGPWNTPENSMKVVRTTEASAKGPGKVTVNLPKPGKTHGFYEDIAVLAVPAPKPDIPKLAELKPTIKLTADQRVEDGSLFMDGKPETAYVITNGNGSVSVDIAFDKPITAAAIKILLRGLDWAWKLSAQAKVEASDDGVAYREIAKFPIHLFEVGATVETERSYPFAARTTARCFRLSYKIPRPAWTRSAFNSIEFTDVFPVTDLDRKTFRTRGTGGMDDSSAVAASDPNVIDPAKVIDLTDQLVEDDTVTCELPAGDWKILRFGYASNGRHNHPASKFGGGLEVDKLSAKALDIHFDQYVGKIADAVGCKKGLTAHPTRASADEGFRTKGFNNVLVDSYEVGTQTWTQGFDREFERRVGYSIRPWLPTLLGRMVGDSEATDRFLWDYRRVMCDMFAENYAEALRKRCHERGLKLSLEGYGNCTSDDLQYGASADVPMGEFWSSADVWNEGQLSIGNSTFPASISHVWGQKYVGAEAFTASAGPGGRWEKDPAGLRAQNDAAWTAGINRMIYHRYAMQPWTKPNYLPGMTMGPWGTHFERTLTWWKQGKAWVDYQTRGQFLLQQGNFVADALLFNGEDVPNEGAVGHMPKGYAGDACTVEALKALKVDNGEIVAPSGSRYRMLVLPDAKAMTLGTLGELERLAETGATIVGKVVPEKSLSLRERGSDAEVKARAEKLWARPNVLQLTREEALEHLSVAPDFLCDSKARTSYLHRRLVDGTEIYFIANHVRNNTTIEASFRVTGLVPERWNAEDGTVARCRRWWEHNGRTYVRLDINPDEGVFVVFRKGADEKIPLEAPRYQDVNRVFGGEIAADWELEFPVLPVAGAKPTRETKKIQLPKLVDWTALEDPDMKYFSGTATYRKTVTVEAGTLTNGFRAILDLGDVKNFAEVTINGKPFQVLWHAPFRLDVTESVKSARKGRLEIEVKVTNLWPNRLIGDEFLPEDAEWEDTWANGSAKLKAMPQWVKDGKTSPNGRHTFTTWKHWRKTDRLLPSGLKGPVTLKLVKPVTENLAVSQHSSRKLTRGWEFARDEGRELKWKKVEVPHDWAIEGPFDPLGDGGTGKLPWKGKGVYRLSLNSPGELNPDRINELVFEGVMARSRVFFNEHELGGSDYGYMGYRVDLTPFIKTGKNELVVKVDTLDHHSRWYPGAGIYRRVLLEQHTGPRVIPDTMAITTHDVTRTQAVVKVSCETTMGPTNFSFVVKNPRLWDVADRDPALYTLDFLGERFRYGIRTAEFTVDRGFLLNGRRVEIRGACLHSDLGILGMAFNKSAMRRQLTILKEMGYNGVRTSHNCPAPELLDLCDEMGFVVWDECYDKWDATAGRRPDQNLEEYISKYLRIFVKRDRNHPSVVIWSIGNEIDSMTQEPDKKDGTTRERCRLFREVVRSEDTSRPVGIACCAWYESVVQGEEFDDLDVAGWNYSSRYAFYRGKRPNQPVIESESASCISSPGYYADTWPTNKYNFALDAKEVDQTGRNCPGWGDPPDRDYERMTNDLYCAGQFVWTGHDYLGENWPYCRGTEKYGVNLSPNEYARSSYFGVCDLLCLPKEGYWNYRANWRPDVHTLQISPMHWTFPGREGQVRPVQVYTDYDTVELFINGKSYGRRTKDSSAKSYPQRFWGDDCEDSAGYYKVLSRYRLMWPEAVYEPGVIMAVAYDRDGKPAMTSYLRTAEKPLRVVLEPEANQIPGDGETYVFVKVTTEDANGTFVPNNFSRVTFKLEGPGEIVSVGNANPRGHESFKDVSGHMLHYGVAGLFVRRLQGGKPIRLTASCEGLQAAAVEFK